MTRVMVKLLGEAWAGGEQELWQRCLVILRRGGLTCVFLANYPFKGLLVVQSKYLGMGQRSIIQSEYYLYFIT